MTNEGRSPYAELLLYCSNLVLCETDFTTLQDGIISDFKFQACKCSNVYLYRHSDQYHADYLFSQAFPGDFFPEQNAEKYIEYMKNIIKCYHIISLE